jgi:hypothetical protein
VEKIIVIVSGKRADEDLTALLKGLFPECEIVIVSPDKEAFGTGQSTAESAIDEIEKEKVDDR